MPSTSLLRAASPSFSTIAAMVLAMTWAPPLLAQVYTYTGPNFGLWTTASNWTPAVVPDSATAQAVFAGDTAPHSVSLANTSVTVNQIDIQGLGTSGIWSITNGTVHLAGANARYRSERWNNNPTLQGGTLPAVVLDGPAQIWTAFLYGRTDVLDGISGTGPLTVTGPGSLYVNGSSTLTGDIIADGVFHLPTGATITAAAVRAGGSVFGGGTFAEVALLPGGHFYPGDFYTTPTAPATMQTLVWNGNAAIHFDLGTPTTTDSIVVTGAFTRGSSGSFSFDFTISSVQPVGTVFTLITFASQTGFTAADFTYGFTGMDTYNGHFVVNPTSLQFVVDPVPVTLQSFDID